MRKTSFMSVFMTVLILLAVAGVIAFVVMFINNGQKNFCVQYGDKEISAKADNIILQKNSVNMFYCKNVLGLTEKSEKATEFTVTVELVEKAFSDIDVSGFTVDGTAKYLFRSSDVTAAFDVDVAPGYFTVYLPETLTLADVLGNVYAGKELDGVPDVDLYAKVYMQIVVYSEVDKATVKIGFH